MLISKNSASQYPGYAAAQRAVSLTSFAHDHHALKIDCMPQPAKPKIYHIVHVDRLPSIVACQGLLCDAEVLRRCAPGTTIGMSSIKQRRLSELSLTSHPGLHVGDCVPFYFCPRSIMLYLIHQANHSELTYRGGQDPIVHLECDLLDTVAWAKAQGWRWAFTLSNAGSRYFEDRADLACLTQIDWEAVQAIHWQSHKEGKQAEFLLENQFPWNLVTRIGVKRAAIAHQVAQALPSNGHRPVIETRADWYY